MYVGISILNSSIQKYQSNNSKNIPPDMYEHKIHYDDTSKGKKEKKPFAEAVKESLKKFLHLCPSSCSSQLVQLVCSSPIAEIPARTISTEAALLISYKTYIIDFLKKEKEYFLQPDSIENAVKNGRSIIRTFDKNAEDDIDNLLTSELNYSGKKGVTEFFVKDNHKYNSDGKKIKRLHPLCGRLITGDNIMFTKKGDKRIAIITFIPKQEDLIKIHEMFDYCKANKKNPAVNNTTEFKEFIIALRKLKATITRPDMFGKADMWTKLLPDEKSGKEKITPTRVVKTRESARYNAINYEKYITSITMDDYDSLLKEFNSNEITFDLRPGYPCIICSFDNDDTISDTRENTQYLNSLRKQFPEMTFYDGNISTKKVNSPIHGKNNKLLSIVYSSEEGPVRSITLHNINLRLNAFRLRYELRH